MTTVMIPNWSLFWINYIRKLTLICSKKKQQLGFPDSFLVFEQGYKINGFSRFLESYYAIALGEGAFNKLIHHDSRDTLVIYIGLFLYYHEYAHLIQERYVEKDNRDLAQSVSGDVAISISHLKELDADNFAGRQIGLRIIDSFKKQQERNTDTGSEYIEDLTAVVLSGIIVNLVDTIGMEVEAEPFNLENLGTINLIEADPPKPINEGTVYPIEVSAGSTLEQSTIKPVGEFDLKSKTHPDQLARIENIKQALVHIIIENLPSHIGFDGEKIFNDAVRIAEGIMEWGFDNPVTIAIEKYRKRFPEIQNYLNEARESGKAIPALCLHQPDDQL